MSALRITRQKERARGLLGTSDKSFPDNMIYQSFQDSSFLVFCFVSFFPISLSAAHYPGFLHLVGSIPSLIPQRFNLCTTHASSLWRQINDIFSIYLLYKYHVE